MSWLGFGNFLELGKPLPSSKDVEGASNGPLLDESVFESGRL